MRGARVQFPTIVGLVNDSSGAAPSQQAAQAIVGLLRKLHDQQPGGLLLVYQTSAPNLASILEAVRDAGIESRALSSYPPLEIGVEQKVDSGTEKLDLIEASHLLVLVHQRDRSEPSSEELDVSKYAKSIGRPVVEVDAETGAQTGEFPAGVIHDSGWLPAIFAAVGVANQDDLSVIRSRTAVLARHGARVTRRWWIWLLLLQGIAVLLPLMWFTKRWTGIGLSQAILILLSVVLVVTITWWLRWRGMQKIWARARLVAEVGRSMLATQTCPRMPSLRVLGIVPALRPLRWCRLPLVEGDTGLGQWRKRYIQVRIDDQENHFSKKQIKLEKQRAQLNRWATLLLDVSLAFAAAGLVIVLRRKWVDMFGGAGLETVFGIAGVASIVALILIETFSNLEGLDRGIAICVRQREMLGRAKARLNSISSEGLGMDVVEETERQLLGEVVEWYFGIEKGEHFYSLRQTPETALGLKPPPAMSRTWHRRWTEVTLAKLGSATFLIFRVLIGRVPWVLGSAAAALLWLGTHEATHTAARSNLRELGSFVDTSNNLWVSDQERAEHGCVIIVHGLWGNPKWIDSTTGIPSWTKRMANAIETRMDNSRPNILLLDWNRAATPSTYYGSDVKAFWRDIVGIRTQAYEVADFASIRLARMIQDGSIRRDRPLHLIGHSAGGFVVTRIAILLNQLQAVPSRIHITLLDTPAQLPDLPLFGALAAWRDDEVLKALPQSFPNATDFYVTSTLVQIPKEFKPPGLNLCRLPHESEGWEKDHQYACEWFIKTIEKPGSGEGFDRSPLIKRN